MKIRFGTVNDLEEVQRLNKLLFEYERDHVLRNTMMNPECPYQPAGITYFTDALKGERNAVVFIAEADGKIVGYLTAYCRSFPYFHENPLAELDNMFVEESHRGKGVGSSLIKAFKDWAGDLGASHLQVMAWSENHPAIGFYRQHGFKDHALRLTQPSPKQ
jgi:GNAT superfamily N-acetyltransferase